MHQWHLLVIRRLWHLLAVRGGQYLVCWCNIVLPVPARLHIAAGRPIVLALLCRDIRTLSRGDLLPWLQRGHMVSRRRIVVHKVPPWHIWLIQRRHIRCLLHALPNELLFGQGGRFIWLQHVPVRPGVPTGLTVLL